jgi:hypothetical protein
MVGSGVLWTLAYLLMIRRSFLDRTYGMPLVALCANLSWELTFAFVYPHDLPQRAVNVVWLSFDLVIALQLLLYGPGGPQFKKPHLVFTGMAAAFFAFGPKNIPAELVQFKPQV